MTYVNQRRMIGSPDDVIAFDLRVPLRTIEAIPYPKPNVPRSRAVQHMQLSRAMASIMPKVETGDAEAIALMLKVHKREADLLGLDAPKEVISHNFEGPARDLSGMTVDELKRMAMEHIEATTIDVTPTRADEPAEPDPALARFRSARGSD